MKPISPGAKREAARRNSSLRPARPSYPNYGAGFARWYQAQTMVPFMVQEIDAIRADLRSHVTLGDRTYYEPYTLYPVPPGHHIEWIWMDWPAEGLVRKEWGRLVCDPAPTGEDH